ncbi:BTB super family protein [Acanthamoeba polyphaga mimivirus]|uniref:BTB super family protein n=1 Tax=Acanthamoeba polyphaga mimivirus TaxID=212035 RepID=A0A0G2Y7A1_MIMIV|nr:BTB super family protein [Acanthamoeba castellanii mamavirus]AKI79652.1 BTB super family protein [Acanthamoeba polyphaga mimivirus]EJN40485.1 hypothetical protein lvs_R760 [Acanthamoeba polyphaga lentillevirus]UMZ07581.1 BTB super family protein [Acanthamoeba polyphaga mimivirus]
MSREIIIQTNNATIYTTYSTISNIKLFTDNIQPETRVIYLNIDGLIVDGILNNIRQGLNALTNYENYDFSMCTNRNCALINIGGRKFYLPRSLLSDFDFFNEILSETEFDLGQNIIDRSPYVFDKIAEIINNGKIVCRSTLSKCKDSFTINLFNSTYNCIAYNISSNDNSKLVLYSDIETEHNIILKFEYS